MAARRSREGEMAVELLAKGLSNDEVLARITDSGGTYVLRSIQRLRTQMVASGRLTPSGGQVKNRTAASRAPRGAT